MTHPTKTIYHPSKINRKQKKKKNGHQSAVLWFTGLSGSGKSTLAHAVEEKLHLIGCHTFVLDGDDIRNGLCSYLGFSLEDRAENIRRVSELVKLTTEAGAISLTAFISPVLEDRKKVRALVPKGLFFEIYCQCPLELCEQRDHKGLYKLARIGKIKNFTGISSPYEPPENPELVFNTERTSPKECVDQVLSLLYEKKIIQQALF